MASFCDDTSLYSALLHGQDLSLSGDTIVSYMDWSDGILQSGVFEDQPLCKLLSTPSPELRAIFAPPLDQTSLPYLYDLINHYHIPLDFLNSNLRGVAQISGAGTLADASQASWFKFLFKSIDVIPDPDSSPDSGFFKIVDGHPKNGVRLAGSNWGWIKSSFFLRWHPDPAAPAGQSKFGKVTLICFGYNPERSTLDGIFSRFESLSGFPAWQSVTRDPFELFVIVLEELFKQIDRQVWNLSGAFRKSEHNALKTADDLSRGVSNPSQQDFVPLHNMAKHCIFMIEGIEAMKATVKNIIEQHEFYLDGSPDFNDTCMRLKHRKALISSTRMQMESLKSRTENVIDLAYNLVTQQDSRVALKDSETMKIISIVTLFFLPMATVATIFSSPFFDVDFSQSPSPLSVAETFWIFWVVVVIVTVLIASTWLAFQKGWFLNPPKTAKVASKPARKAVDAKSWKVPV